MAEALRRCRARLETLPENAQEVERPWRELDLDFVRQGAPEALER